MNYVYTAGIYCDVKKWEYKISIGKEPYEVNKFDDCIVKRPYFVSENYSTYELGKYLDCGYQITDKLAVYYSKDKNKVYKFVKEWKKDFEKRVKDMVNTLKNLEINDKTSDGEE